MKTYLPLFLAELLAASTNGKEPDDQLYIKRSDEIGKWGGNITKAKLPDRFLVDYVRVYEFVDAK